MHGLQRTPKVGLREYVLRRFGQRSKTLCLLTVCPGFAYGGLRVFSDRLVVSMCQIIRCMDAQVVRDVIRYKLLSGALPRHGASTVFGSPANGETCSGCGSEIPTGQLMIDGVARKGRGRALPFHVLCFEVWNDERRATSLIEQRTA